MGRPVQLPARVGPQQPNRSPLLVRSAATAVQPFDPIVRAITPDDAADLVRSAQRQAKLEDLGPGEVLEPLQVLMDTLREDPHVSALGRLGWTIILRRLLVSRLRVVDHVRRHPEIHDVAVERPLIILGLPRTGTTLLYQLLATHPGARPLMGWESYTPVPPTGRDRRRGSYRRYVWAIDKLVPALRTIHELDADAPDEGLELMDRTFHSLNFMLYAYGYIEYLQTLGDERFDESWELYLWQLQMLQLQSMKDFWLLKAPGFIGAFGALDKHLPDARFVMTHRDLRQALPSAMSLVTAVGTAMRRPGHQLGLPDFLNQFVDRIRLTRTQLADKPKVEILYPDLITDPVGVVSRILDELGESVPNDLEQRVARVLAASPQHKNGKHRYSLEQFGFDARELEPIAARFDREVGLDRRPMPGARYVDLP